MKLSDEGTKGSDMDCRRVEDEDIIERYLAEKLSERESEAFEQHYLGCKQCFGELRMRHAAAIEISALPIPAKPDRSWWTPVSRHGSQWGLVSMAVALIVAFGIFYLRPQNEIKAPLPQVAEVVKQPSDAVIEQLASIDPVPPYLPSVIRGAGTDPALIKFREGMNLYSMQKYAEAIPLLNEAARLDPTRHITAFYLGIAHLVSGNTDAAIEQLTKVTAQENPYAEEGHWFLSKAHLKKRNFRSARSELQTVVSLRGAHSSAAQDVLNRIQNY
jgi:hypothetical protein